MDDFSTSLSSEHFNSAVTFLFQGNFFANIGSIIVFAIFGTAVSAIVIGGGIYLLGKVSGFSVFKKDLLEKPVLGDQQPPDERSVRITTILIIINLLACFMLNCIN